jgi:histidinol dehydrogenase
MNGIVVRDLRELDVVPSEFLRRAEYDLSSYLPKAEQIINTVRVRGDDALIEYGKQLDRVSAETFSLRVTREEFDAAHSVVSPEVKAAISYAADNIQRFHEAQKPEKMWVREIRPGAFAGERCLPIDTVACYVPFGRRSFPSALMMTAIPAIVADVPRIVVITPPGPDGKVDAGTLVAAQAVGVEEIYKCGGAQAIAAVAYGTQSVPRCSKVVGPGSPWVSAAKQLVRDVIETGVPTGPSECVILADEMADGQLIALDLAIESEHGHDSSAYLVTTSPEVAHLAAKSLGVHLSTMTSCPRAQSSRAVLSGPYGGILLVKSLDTAIRFVNDYAPEHLQVHAAEPMAVLGRITNAAKVLLGPYTPVCISNFVLGPNAVLPTWRHARTTSPLNVHDFLKRTSFGYVTAAGYPQLAQHAEVLARYEGFIGNANAGFADRVAQVRRTANQ